MKGCVILQTRDRLSIPMHQVDAHNVVPVWEASDKKETAARTIRKKIHTKLPTYLTVPTASGCTASPCLLIDMSHVVMARLSLCSTSAMAVASCIRLTVFC